MNVANISIWMGHRLCGMRGALASLAGIVLPPAILIVLLSLVFAWLSRFPVTHLALVDGGWPARIVALAAKAILMTTRTNALLALAGCTAAYVGAAQAMEI